METSTPAPVRLSIYPGSVPCPTVASVHPTAKLAPSADRLHALADQLGRAGEAHLAVQVRHAADDLDLSRLDSPGRGWA